MGDSVKLGKLPPKVDQRTIKMASLWKTAVCPSAPDSFDVDKSLTTETIDNPGFANDIWGDCVIAGRGHMTRRFELFEQKKLINITDQEILNEYWAEGSTSLPYPHRTILPTPCQIFQKIKSNHPDNGLVMVTSLNCWRKNGWTIGDKKYYIYAYAGVNWRDPAEVKATIYLLRGIYVGIALPSSAQKQYTLHQDWTDSQDAPNSWGNHCVAVIAYDSQFLTCITWGRVQRMTWQFFLHFCDEAYAVLDNVDPWLGNASPVDIPALDSILKEITS